MGLINKEEILEKIGKNLHTIRNGQKLTLEKVAKELELTHPVISKIENGRHTGLTITMLVNICNYYKTTLEEVMQFSDSQVFHFTQKIEGGTNTNKQIGNDVSEGYLLCIEQQKSEILFLKELLKGKK